MKNNQYFKIDSLKELDICVNYFGNNWSSPNKKLDKNLLGENFNFIVKSNDKFSIQNKRFVKYYNLKEVPKPEFLFKEKSKKLLSSFRVQRLRNSLSYLDDIEKQFAIDKDKELQEEITRCEESLFKCCDELGMKVEITYNLKSSINQ